jgi:hypothetical protein
VLGATIERFRTSPVRVFFVTLGRASPRLAGLWWALLLVGGVLPAVFVVSTGLVVSAVEGDGSMTLALTVAGLSFVGLQVMGPVHQTVGTLLGHRAADWMNDRLLEATTTPPGLAHLERPDLGADLTMARDFDLGITAPPLHISMGFIADGLRLLVAGAASAVVLARFRWWAPLVVGGAWLSTHWLLRESGVWKDRRTDAVQTAQRHADYAFRMAVDSPAAKEVRLFGLADWVLDRFTTRRTELFELQWEATRLRQRSTLSSLAVVTAANALVF